MRTISEAVAAVLGTDTAVDVLVRVRFASDSVHYLSDRYVGADESFDGNEYEPQVVADTLGEISWALGEQSALDLDNTDGWLTTLANSGVRLEQGEVAIVLQFRDVSPPSTGSLGDWDDPFWRGWIRAASHPGRELVRLDLLTGPAELSRRCPRRIRASCYKPFADGYLCPYAPLDGHGRISTLASGTATGSSATTIVDTSGSFVSAGIAAGQVVMAWNATDAVSVGHVTEVAATTITVDEWRFGGTPAAGWTYEAGPAFTLCDGSKASCVARGMFGINGTQTSRKLNAIQRRWYGGWSPPATSSYTTRILTGLYLWGAVKTRKRLSVMPKQHEGLDGDVIPLVFGNVHLKNILPVAQGWAGDYFHVLLLMGEGRMSGATSFTMDGQPHHTISSSTTLDDSPLILYGFGQSGPGTDADDVPAELTEIQRQDALGQLAAYAVLHGQELATYAGNPRLFNYPDGDGVSMDGLAMARVRVKISVDRDHIPSCEAKVTGMHVLKADGTWTAGPNPVDTTFYHLVNRKWGAGLDPSFVDADSFDDASDYCDAYVTNSQTQEGGVVLSGTASYGPMDVDGPVNLDTVDWLMLGELFNISLDGMTIEILTAGKEQTAVIRASQTYTWGEELPPDSGGGGSGGEYPAPPPPEEPGSSGRQTLVFIEGAWESGKVPGSGDGWRIENIGSPKRYVAAGRLETMTDALSLAQTMLDNCAGRLFLRGGRIGVYLLRQANLTTVNALPAISDSGSSRNVVYRTVGHGMEPAVDWRADQDPPNEIVFEYLDERAGYEKRTRAVRSSTSQLRRAADFGYTSRDAAERSVDYALTTSLDQAARLASIELREYGQRDAGRSNGTLVFQMPFRHGLALEPGDVRAVSLTRLPSWITYARIEAARLDLQTWVWTFEARPYVHDNFDDTADDLSDLMRTDPLGFVDDAGSYPIESLTEGQILDRQGRLIQTIRVVFSLPESE